MPAIAVLSDDPYIGRFGLKEIDLNKLMEKNGFVKVRDRSACSQQLLADSEDDAEDVDSGSKCPKGT